MLNINTLTPQLRSHDVTGCVYLPLDIMTEVHRNEKLVGQKRDFRGGAEKN